MQACDADFAEYLSPQQVSVGVSGGISIVVYGLRLLVQELRPGFVLVRIDLKNAYNACDRATALRRLAAIPSFAHLVPFLHAFSGPQFWLLVRSALGGGLQRLFADDPTRIGDSSTGFAQGRAPSSPSFCVAIQPEVRDLDAELSIFGGCARFISDDGYAAGPAQIVFPAVARFRRAFTRRLGLSQMTSSSATPLSMTFFLVPTCGSTYLRHALQVSRQRSSLRLDYRSLLTRHHREALQSVMSPWVETLSFIHTLRWLETVL
jgi:hypothetical protein